MHVVLKNHVKKSFLIAFFIKNQLFIHFQETRQISFFTVLKFFFLINKEEIVKASLSSDDNKKKFFEIASYILKNLGLFQGANRYFHNLSFTVFQNQLFGSKSKSEKMKKPFSLTFPYYSELSGFVTTSSPRCDRS